LLDMGIDGAVKKSESNHQSQCSYGKVWFHSNRK
jgi:hypothetical protein